MEVAKQLDPHVYITEEGEVVSTIERYCKDFPPPASNLPTDEEFYSKSDTTKPDLDHLKEHFKLEGRLTESQALFIISAVCGDIHGQYYDLMKLLEIGGPIDKTKYLFLGDYVDRGYFSIECFLYLLAAKIWFPGNIFLLRGNHECKHLTSHFTFKTECAHKYGQTIFDAAVTAFNSLPLVAIVNKQFFCVHGGISPDIDSLEDINKIDRFREPPTKGLYCDLLWSDPIDTFGQEKSSESFVPNRVRGCSYSYTYEGVCKFLEKFNLLSLIRAHEAQDNGYRMYKKTKQGFPAVITMFSAPNYLDVYNNKGAILKYNGETLNVRQFNHSPHPYWLPNFMDVFSWSIPFVGEKLTDMLLAILDFSSKEDTLDESLTDTDHATLASEQKKRKLLFRRKVEAIGKLSRNFTLLREQRETIMELKNALGSDALPCGTLALGIEEMKKTINSFEEAKDVDIQNEHLPPGDIYANNSLSAPSLVAHSEMLHENNSSSTSLVLEPTPKKVDDLQHQVPTAIVEEKKPTETKAEAIVEPIVTPQHQPPLVTAQEKDTGAVIETISRSKMESPQRQRDLAQKLKNEPDTSCCSCFAPSPRKK